MPAAHSVDAKQVIGEELDPSADGTRLGKYIVDNRVALPGLTIDVTELAPEDLISSFVNAVMFTLEQSGLSLADAAKVKWKTKFPSEAERLAEFIALYRKKKRP